MALDADCRSKADAIKQAVQLLHQAGRSERPHELEHSLMQREAVSSTGFGHGFAIPHCKSSAVRADSLVILKLRNPVEWNSMDHQPVNLVILMVIREGGPPETHLQILAQLARKVMDETFRERMAGEPDPAALAAFLKARLNF